MSSLISAAVDLGLSLDTRKNQAWFCGMKQSALWLYGAEECAEQLVALDKRKTTAGSYLRRNVKQLIKQICAAVDPAL